MVTILGIFWIGSMLLTAVILLGGFGLSLISDTITCGVTRDCKPLMNTVGRSILTPQTTIHETTLQLSNSTTLRQIPEASRKDVIASLQSRLLWGIISSILWIILVVWLVLHLPGMHDLGSKILVLIASIGLLFIAQSVFSTYILNEPIFPFQGYITLFQHPEVLKDTSTLLKEVAQEIASPLPDSSQEPTQNLGGASLNNQPLD